MCGYSPGRVLRASGGARMDLVRGEQHPVSTQRRARLPCGEWPPPWRERPAGVVLSQALCRQRGAGHPCRPWRPLGARPAQGAREGCCHPGRQGWSELVKMKDVHAVVQVTQCLRVMGREPAGIVWGCVGAQRVCQCLPRVGSSEQGS